MYFDNNATTVLCQEAIISMQEEMSMGPSNPSSSHALGRSAKKRVYEARETAAQLLNCSPSEIVFTSGGTESLNMLIRGYAHYGEIMTTYIEHAAVYQTITALKPPEEIHFIPVDSWGAPKVEMAKRYLTPKTKIIVLSGVNSETGVKLDLKAFAQFALEHQLIFIVDGVALLGKEEIELVDGISAMAFSAHKFHGPQGMGMCYINEYAPPMQATQVGGPQELERRAGTENMVAISGLRGALSRLQTNQDQITEKLKNLQHYFESQLKQEVKGACINGDGPRIGNTSNIFFEGIDAESLLILLDQNGIYASHGSACSSGSVEPSRVLSHMGDNYRKRAKSSLRFSFSAFNTYQEIDALIGHLKKFTTKLTNLSGASA